MEEGKKKIDFDCRNQKKPSDAQNHRSTSKMDWLGQQG